MNDIKATNYYISPHGNDINNGVTKTQAWKTIEKLNASFNNLQPGDKVLFECGGTYFGTILISKSGTLTNAIEFSSYGIGLKPVITGFKPVITWVNEGNGIFSSVVSASVQTNMVIIDEVQFAMGRYPDNNYLTYQTGNDNNITSNNLNNNFNWTGAEAVIRKNDFSLDRCIITNTLSYTLTFTNKCSKYPPKPNYGFFIQNDLRTLTKYGEWYHDILSNKFYMYFGNISPNSKKVRIATVNNLIKSGKNTNYITINKLNFNGSIDNSMIIETHNNGWVIKNNEISFCGKNAIYLSYDSDKDSISNNVINYCNNDGILCFGTSTTITGNSVKNIGVIPGQALDPYYYTAIYTSGYGSVISYNVISNIGGSAIFIGAHGTVLINYNKIDSACSLLDDGGGIYTGGPNVAVRTIDHNFITNTIGNDAGTPRNQSYASAIYLDDLSTNIIVTNNTVAHNHRAGIFIHRGNNIIVKNNMSFDNKQGLLMQNNSSKSDIYGNQVTSNIFVAKTSDQYAAQFISNNNDIVNFGNFDGNYYGKQANQNRAIAFEQPDGGFKEMSLDNWKSFNNQEVNHSKLFSADISNKILFDFNASTYTKKINLFGSTYWDLQGKSYKDFVIIPAWGNLLLILK